MFKRNPSAAVVTQVQSQHEAAKARLEAARATYSLTLEELTQEGAVDLQAIAKARTKVDSAEAEERAARDALAAVQARHSAAEAEAARKATEARYDEAIRAAKARAENSRTIVRLLGELAAAYEQMNAQTVTIARALPDAKDADGAVLRQPQVDGLLRLEMYRVGLPGSAGVQPRHEVTPIDDRFAETAGLLLSWKQWALGAMHG